MTSYASDSDEEAAAFTETNVLLGYVSPTPSSDTISYIGGAPAWLDPTAPPSAALARCKVCRDIMVLLLQLNGELPDFPGHERRIYVLSCRRKACRRKEGSVKALRGVKVIKEEKRVEKRSEKKEQSPSSGIIKNTAFGESLFGAKPATGSGNANPFSSAGVGHPANPFSPPSSASSTIFSKATASPTPAESTSADLPKTFASALNLNNEQKSNIFGPVSPPEPWPQISEMPHPYPKYYFDQVENEQLDEEDIPIPQATMTMDLDDESGSSSAPQKEDKDTYESTIDKEFQKFADRLAQNPEQVIRYEFKGQPLLYSKTDAIGKLLSPSNHYTHVTTTSGTSRIPRCSNCGGNRVFEVQMTPHAILELEAEEMSMEGMDWGTIIIGVCERDCTPSGTNVGETAYLEEWTGVQWEELSGGRG